MTTFALSLVLLSALFHATWNLFAKRSSGGVPFVWLFDAASVLFYAPLALGFWATQPISLGWVELAAILISSVLHLAYFLSLQRGYRVGDLSLVYPLARGTGPLFSVLAAILILGERPTPLAFLGALLIVFSVFIFAGGGTVLRSGAGLRRALRFGLVTGVFIASYTLFDKVAVSTLLIPPLLFNWLGNAGRAVLLMPLALKRWQAVRLEWQEHKLEVVMVALLSPLAYILVLSVLVFTPVSYVAPAREVSILIGTLLGARFLGEGALRQQLAAAAVMVLGVALLAFG